MTKQITSEELAEMLGKQHNTTIEAMEAASKSITAISERLADVEQRVLEGKTNGGDGPAPAKTPGEMFVADERVKAWLADAPRHGRVDLKIKTTLTSATTDAAGSVGAAGGQAYRDTPVITPRRRLRVRSLLPKVNITTGLVEWPSMKGRTEGAAMVAEGAAKPASDTQFEMKTASPKVIAHWMKASRQILSDAPQLQGLINTELMDGLGLKEEQQLLTGDGTGQNLYGMIPQATAYSAPMIIGDLNMADVIGLAALQVSNAFFEPDAAIVNPSDWWSMRLMKNSDGDYIFGPPNVDVTPVIFGLPLVATPAMTARKFLVSQFRAAATIYDRWEARVEIATENEDDFIKNLVTVLAEERLAFGVKNPSALVFGDFDSALAA